MWISSLYTSSGGSRVSVGGGRLNEMAQPRVWRGPPPPLIFWKYRTQIYILEVSVKNKSRISWFMVYTPISFGIIFILMRANGGVRAPSAPPRAPLLDPPLHGNIFDTRFCTTFYQESDSAVTISSVIKAINYKSAYLICNLTFKPVTCFFDQSYLLASGRRNCRVVSMAVKKLLNDSIVIIPTITKRGRYWGPYISQG